MKRYISNYPTGPPMFLFNKHQYIQIAASVEWNNRDLGLLFAKTKVVSLFQALAGKKS